MNLPAHEVMPADRPSSLDPATLAVVQNAMRQIVDEMDLALERSAFNPVMSESRDRANGIYALGTGDVLAQGITGLPIFVGVMQFAVRSVLQAFPQLQEGDVVLLNDPYCGGTHLMDMKLIRPFFYRGRPFAVLANCGHWTDIGGNVPGGFGVKATEIIQEGVRVPPILLYRKGELQEGILDLLLANMRVPEERRGDLQAQIAALNVGEERLTNLLDKYGMEVVSECLDQLSERSEVQMRAHIAALEDGEYQFETQLDSDGIVLNQIDIRLKMTVIGDELTFNFDGSSPPVAGPLNCAASATESAVFVALKHVFPEIPINAGIFKPVKIALPDHCFLNATYPKAVSGSSAEVSLRVVDAVFGCLAQCAPARTPAACFGSVGNFTLSGFDPIRKKPYIMFRFSGGGYGGTSKGDGLINGNAPIGAARTSSIEISEALYPVIFDHYIIREESAGAGRHRGGFGMEFQVRVAAGTALSSVLGDRGRFAPFGLYGGGSAKLAEVEYCLEGRAFYPKHVTKDENVFMECGDTARVATAGGGGWGNPRDRDPIEVLRDVNQGFISDATANDVYGVSMVREGRDWVIADQSKK